jgi:hypothetical protein
LDHFRQVAYEKAIQMKVNAAEVAFSPSEEGHASPGIQLSGQFNSSHTTPPKTGSIEVYRTYWTTSNPARN